MDKKKWLELLKKEPIFWSCLGLGVVTTEHPHVMRTDNLDHFAKFHDDFAKAGVDIHTSILPSGWFRDGALDFSLTDLVLDALFASGKVKYYFPRIEINVPVDWCRNHPEDVAVYEEGPRDAEEIRKLVATPRHDLYGYESEVGCYLPWGESLDDRPNVGGLITMQSLSSKQWLADAGEALRALIRHIEDGPYGDRIIGYQFAYGVSGECNTWGHFSDRQCDYGVNHQKAFFAWYRENIDPDAVWESGDFVPSRAEKLRGGNDIYTQIRSRERDKKAIAYDRFVTEMNVAALEHFGRIVKEESGKLAGAFYGYTLHVSRSAYCGYLGWQRLLQSGCVDFFAAPKSYYRSGFGDCGGSMAPVFSVNRRALWIDECDLRTHLSVDDAGGKAENMEETRFLLWREYAKNAAQDSGCWWMDLGNGWYDDAEIMREVARIVAANKSIKGKPHHTVADVLYVVDEESLFYADERFNQQILEGNLRRLQHAGVAINVVLQSDLDEIDLAPYKLIVFANALCMTKKALAEIEKRTAARLMFFYASGICQETTELKHCAALTGYTYTAGTAAAGAPAPLCAEQGDSPYFVNTAIPADVAYFRAACRESGCHLYGPQDTAVYTDNRILGVFRATAGEIEICLPRRATLRDLLTGEVHRDVDRIKAALPTCFAVFEYCD